jgi:hypothetical protein
VWIWIDQAPKRILSWISPSVGLSVKAGLSMEYEAAPALPIFASSGHQARLFAPGVLRKWNVRMRVIYDVDAPLPLHLQLGFVQHCRDWCENEVRPGASRSGFRATRPNLWAPLTCSDHNVRTGGRQRRRWGPFCQRFARLRIDWVSPVLNRIGALGTKKGFRDKV